MDMKKIKVEIGLVTVESGVALEIDVDGDIYRKKDASVTVMDAKKESSSETVTKKDPYVRRPKNAIKYEPAYDVWITPEYILQVKQAILQLEPGLKKSFNEIRAKTGLSTNKCRATLKHMKDTDDVISKKTQSEGVTYCLMKDEKIIEEEPIKIEEMEIKQRINKGKKIDTYQGNAIYENVLNEINFLILQGKGDTANLRKIIKKYNSDYKSSTVYQRAHQYRKYVIEKQQNMMMNDKGRKLGMMKKNPIYENILNAIVTAITEGKKYHELEKIIEQYHPGCTKSTYCTYVKMYRRYDREIQKHVSTTVPEKGRVIARLGENSIHENILNDVIQGIKEGMGEKELEGIIKSYHPNVKPSSLYTYLRAHMRYLTSQNIEEYLPKKKESRKYNVGGKKIDRDKTYNINIISEQVTDVLNSLKSGHKEPISIAEDTGLMKYRVQGILHWLRLKAIIKRKYKNGVTRHWVVKKDWRP